VKPQNKGRDFRKLVEDYRRKQQNIIWPGPIINETRIERFLWNGSPNPTLVQRVASWLIGLVLFTCGLALFRWAIRDRASFAAVVVFVTLACAYSFAGFRIFLNGFGRPMRRSVAVPDKKRHPS